MIKIQTLGVTVFIWSLSVVSQSYLRAECRLNDLLPTLTRRWLDNLHKHPYWRQDWRIFVVGESCINVIMGENKLRRVKEGEEQEFQSDFSFLWQKCRKKQTEIVSDHMEFQINARIFRVILTAPFKNNFLSSLAIILHLTFVQLKYKTFLTL